MPARREVREDACEKGGEREKGKDGRENKVAVYASAGCFFLPPTCVELVSIGGSWVYSPDFLVCRVGNEDARGLRIQHFLCYRLRHKYCIPDMFRGVRIEFHWKTIYSSRRGENAFQLRPDAHLMSLAVNTFGIFVWSLSVLSDICVRSSTLVIMKSIGSMSSV